MLLKRMKSMVALSLPTLLFGAALTAAIEADATDPCVQVVDLGGNPNNNVKTILKGLTGADPVRRTPWGTIMVGEEESDGGWYEILDPLSINSPIEVTDRATGATTDPSKVVKRKAVGLLAFEGMVILQDGTMYYGDENRPLGKAGGAIAGDTDANHFDNVAFQPRTGNLIVLEDGAVEVVKSDGSTELRGNDIWMLLPGGADRDVQSDGAIRILSLRDTDSEPTGFIFDASGENAYVHLQHRNTGLGALLKISGFKVKDE